MGPGDRETWARMRAALRPQEPADKADNPLDGLKFEALQIVQWPDPRLLKERSQPSA